MSSTALPPPPPPPRPPQSAPPPPGAPPPPPGAPPPTALPPPPPPPPPAAAAAAAAAASASAAAARGAPPPPPPPGGKRPREEAPPRPSAAPRPSASGGGGGGGARRPGASSSETVPARSSADGSATRPRSDFLCPMPFANALPPPPAELKLLRAPADAERLSAYDFATSLEASHAWEVLPEPDLGVAADLVLPHAFAPRPELRNEPGAADERAASTAHLAPADAALLAPIGGLDDKPAGAAPKGGGPTRGRSALGELHVPWLRRHVYLGNNLYDTQQRGVHPALQQQSSAEAAAAGGALAELTKPTLAARIDAIDASFEAVSRECDGAGPTHPLHPELRPLSVMPVLPDARCWPNAYTHVRFDGDPADGLDAPGKPPADVARAFAKGYALPAADGGAGGGIVAYMVPRAGGGAEGAPRPLEWVREYAHELKPLDGSTYLLVLSAPEGGGGGPEDGGGGSAAALYNEVSGRLELTRRSLAERAASGLNELRPSALTLTRRAANEAEASAREARHQLVAAGPARELIGYNSTPSHSAPPAAAPDAEPEPQPAEDGGGSDAE